MGLNNKKLPQKSGQLAALVLTQLNMKYNFVNECTTITAKPCGQ